MTLFKSIKYFCFILVLSFWSWSHAQTCDFKAVTNQCEFFKNLNPDDVIELANGEKVPACALSSVYSAQAETAMAGTEDAQVELRDHMAQIPTSIFSDRFKQNLAGIGFHRLGDLTHPSDRVKVNLPWPPNQNGAPVREVSTLEFMNYLQSQQGWDRSRLISLMRAADQNQNRQVALALDRPGDASLVRTPAQTRAAFEAVRSESLAFLSQGRSASELSPAMRSAIARVESYNIAIQNPMASGQPPICGPNRGIGGRNNTGRAYIELGEKMNYFPATATYRTLAHEVAHSFDPCRSGVTTFRPSPEFANWVSTQPNVSNPEGIFMRDLPAGSEAVLRGSQVLAEPFSLDDNPFRETYNCLIQQGATGRGHDLNRGLGRFHHRGQDYLNQNGSVQSQAQACEFTQGNEIFCDWFASQILEQMIQKDGALSNANPSASSTASSSPGVVKAPRGYEYLIFNLDEACAEEISGAPMITQGEHPSDRRRVDLMLNNPTVAEALGCERTPDQNIICPANQTMQDRLVLAPEVRPETKPGKSRSKKSTTIE